MKYDLKEMKKCMGDEMYLKVRQFYFNAFVSKYDYKVLLTRRSYVLFKIFENIFENYNEEVENETKERKLKSFDKFGKFLNTHSLCSLYDEEKKENIKILIIDDIIINGRTIKNIFDNLIEKFEYKKDNIIIWSLYTNIEANCLDSYRQNLIHTKFVLSYEWQKYSDALTKFIIASNIGYISYINSYSLHSSLNNIKEKISDKKNIVDLKNNLFEEFNIESFVYFYQEKSINDFNLKVCVRFYERQGEITAIPFLLFLKPVKKEYIYDLCCFLLKKYGINCPKIPNEQKYYVVFYQWTISKISEKIYNDFLIKINEKFEINFKCSESYAFLKKFEKNDLINEIEPEIKNMFEEKLCTDSENEFCEKTFREKSDLNLEIKDIIENYLIAVHSEDEKRAKNMIDRCIGISVYDMIRIINNNKVIDDNKLLCENINLWDTGKAAYMILSDEKVVDGYVRHGEQIYRAFYEKYKNVFLYFYDYYFIKYETRDNELKKFAKYFDENMETSEFYEFVKETKGDDYVLKMKSAPKDFLQSIPNPEVILKDVNLYCDKECI